MDVEIHQLDLRYEPLRRRSPRKERALVASLADIGQQTPIIVVAGEEPARPVVLDGFKRVRALRRLSRDLVRATAWSLAEPDALLLERQMRTGEGETALEQGWLLRELHERFGLAHDELARRFDRSASWVSRRLALVRELPEAVQDHVRKGALVPHAAMKYLVPLARANREDCVRLAAALAAQQLSSRQVGALCTAWASGQAATRELVLANPSLVLRALEQARPKRSEDDPPRRLLSDLAALGAIARRARRLLAQGAVRPVLLGDRGELARCARSAQADADSLFELCDKELVDARPEHPDGDSQAA